MKYLLVSLLLLLTAAPAYASPIRGQNVFNAVNEERKVSQVRPLVPDATLVALAQKKADDMESRNYFGHADPQGKKLYKDFFYSQTRFLALGENLATSFDSNEALMRAWMNSPTHRSNIVEKQYRFTGIGISKSGKYIVQYFAR